MTQTLTRLAQRAKEEPQTAFDTIIHLVDVERLRQAHKQLRKEASAGVDGVQWADYEQNLEQRLQDLLGRLKDKTYRAQPVKRAYLPKGDGRYRPIGIPAHEDKVVQRAVVTVMEAIYEQDFMESSYGFRPGRNAHQALEASWQALMDGQINVVLDADIESFFDTIDKKWLMKMLQHRIKDGSLLRLIGKWLHAGVLEEGTWYDPETGSPQGSVISPLLANVYLHYVLDLWVERVVKKRCRGRVCLYRYADDFLLGFEQEQDAERVTKALRQRLGKFGLKLNEDKTRLIRFGRRAWQEWKRGGPKPPTYTFLGFVHICATSRKGGFVVKRKTQGKRLTRVLKRVWQWCKKNRHRPAKEQQERLNRGLMGHYNYYGLPGNSDRLSKMYYWVQRIWHRWQSRRSQKGAIAWAQFNEFLSRYPLIRPRIRRQTTSWETLSGVT
jgi:RNA-directed DNA polymerase